MQQLSNFGTTTLNGAITNTATSVVVTDGSVFPASGDFIIIIENEIMLVTARSTNTLTVIRGQEGTTAASHVDTTPVKLTLTAGVLKNYFGERIQVGGYASRPSTARDGWLYYADDVNLAWQYNGSNWNLYHPVYVPYANRVDLTSWTGTNLGTSTWTDYNGVLVVSVPQVASAVADRVYYKTKPTAPFKLNIILETPDSNASVSVGGVGFYDSVGGKLKYIYSGCGGNIQNVGVTQHNSVTSWNATPEGREHWGSPIWLQIEDDNTNWYWRLSLNGKEYLTIYTEARNTFLTPDKVCLVVDREENTLPSNEFYQFLAYWEQ